MDGRPLHVRVKALADRFDAIAIGCEKRRLPNPTPREESR